MDPKIVLAAAALASIAVSTYAQAPSGTPPAGGAAGQATGSAPSTQPKIDEVTQRPSQRSGMGRPGYTPPPMDIRIKEGGVKLPKCTAESREGEACKQ